MSIAQPNAHEPEELQTRFLYAFFFDRKKVTAAREALLMEFLAKPDHERVKVWEAAIPHPLYKEELLSQVTKFLFESQAGHGCEYLQLSDSVCNRWFNKLEVRLPGESDFPVRLVTPIGVEIFLCSYGVGLLSIALTPRTEGLKREQVLAFNYRLSQLRSQTAAKLRIAHPRENEALWARLTQEQKSSIPDPPSAGGHIGERLGGHGGEFFISELIQELLRPLERFGLRKAQEQLSLYTVVRFSDKVDFGCEEVRTSLAPFLLSLAQVEEPTHAGGGGYDSTGGIANTMLNRRHWFGVGMLGAAHLIADQRPIEHPFEHPFNAARMSRTVLKYFTPHALAFFQRFTLQRINQEAWEFVLPSGERMTEDLIALRQLLLEFAVEGYFTEVSYREVIHRYYQTCQKGLHNSDTLENTRRAISDIDASNAVNYQIKLAEELAVNTKATNVLQERMTEHLAVVARVQMMLELIEIFLVSVYFAELWHMFATDIASLHAWVPYGVIIGALIGGLASALVLKPWKHWKQSLNKAEMDVSPKGTARLGAASPLPIASDPRRSASTRPQSL